MDLRPTSEPLPLVMLLCIVASSRIPTMNRAACGLGLPDRGCMNMCSVGAFMRHNGLLVEVGFRGTTLHVADARKAAG